MIFTMIATSGVNEKASAQHRQLKRQLKHNKKCNNQDPIYENTSLQGRNVPPRIKKMHDTCKKCEEEESEDESETNAEE